MLILNPLLLNQQLKIKQSRVNPFNDKLIPDLYNKLFFCITPYKISENASIPLNIASSANTVVLNPEYLFIIKKQEAPINIIKQVNALFVI